MKKFVFLFFSLLFATIMRSQSLDFNEKYLESEGIYVFDESIRIQKDEVFTKYKNEFGLGEFDEMKELSIESKEGIFHTRYMQYHKGYPVEGTMMNVIGKEGVVDRITGQIIKNLKIDLHLISEAEALRNALNAVKAEKYRWEEDIINEEGVNISAKYFPKGTLIISRLSAKDIPTESEYYKLCYKFNIQASEPRINEAVYINAANGELFSTHSNSAHSYPTTGQVWTVFNGLRPININSCWGCPNYWLKDNPRNINTEDAGGGKIKSGSSNFFSSDHKTPASAHWAISQAWDYYLNKHGRWTSNSNGMPVRLIFGRIEAGVLNPAEYVGLTSEDEIQLRADGGGLASASALDMMAHEYTHAMIFRSCSLSLNVADFESGALNEGICDIFGEMVEKYVNGSANYIAGSDLGSRTRSLSNPNVDSPISPSIYLQPGIWSSSNSIHANGGVIRKWFHLLAFGGTHNGITVTGIGEDAAASLLYTSFNWWFWSTINYPNAANAIINAAKYHHGLCSPIYQSAIKAFKAVGLNYAGPLCSGGGGSGKSIALNNQKPLLFKDLNKKNVTIDKMQEIIVYPNPASDKLLLMLPNTMLNSEIEMINLEGKTVYKSNFQNNKYELDVTTFEAGFYFIIIKNDNGRFVKKVNIVH